MDHHNTARHLTSFLVLFCMVALFGRYGAAVRLAADLAASKAPSRFPYRSSSCGVLYPPGSEDGIRKSPFGLETFAFRSNQAPNTFCFTFAVTPTFKACTGACCNQPDVKSLEVNVNPACDINGVSLKAFVGGRALKTAPVIEKAANGPTGATILRLTSLGLNRTNADGTDVCITLGNNNAKQGCTNLIDLCTGAPVGHCTVAITDTASKCCMATDIEVPAKPQPPPVLKAKAAGKRGF